MNTIPAREIDRCGIGVVDEKLKDGPVYVIKNDEPTYVILDERRYRDLLEAEHEAYIARVKASLEDVAAGRVEEVDVEELIAGLSQEI